MREMFACGNLESWALKPGIQLRESGIPITISIRDSLEVEVPIPGIRNPPRPGIWNPRLYLIKTESTRKLGNFNFQWTKTLYQNNLRNIGFFFYIFQGLKMK